MDETLANAVPRISLLALAYGWFHRLVAASCLIFGLHYWIRLIGYHEGELWRFDLMPVYWQVASVSLAVAFPFAASGLWMLATWGPVIWFLCAGGEAIMHLGFPELFGERFALMAVHLATLVLFVAFRLATWLEVRRGRQD